jgi:hypothetical protein
MNEMHSVLNSPAAYRSEVGGHAPRGGFSTSAVTESGRGFSIYSISYVRTR